MAKRKQQPDPRWSRTPDRLLVPRKPTLPSRRFLQWMGVPQNCCGEEEDDCTIICRGRGALADEIFDPVGYFHVSLSGFADGTCDECESLSIDDDLLTDEIGSGACGSYNDGYYLCGISLSPGSCNCYTNYVSRISAVAAYIQQGECVIAGDVWRCVIELMECVQCGAPCVSLPVVTYYSDWIELSTGTWVPSEVRAALISGVTCNNYELERTPVAVGHGCELCDYTGVTAVMSYTPP